MSTLRIETQSMARTASLSRGLNEARALRIEVNQYGKRKPAKPTSLVIINKTQGRRITYA